jgi:dihydrofolate reductase/thymidylate synthase
MNKLNITKFNVILATDSNGGLGYKNELAWEFISDFNFFKYITTSHQVLPGINNSENILIMGRKTWESMGKKSLIGRESWVITSQYKELNETNTNPNIRFFKDFYHAYISASGFTNRDIWVVGGAKIYQEALVHWACGKIYWTKIHGSFNSDVFINVSDYMIDWDEIITKTDINNKDGNSYELTFCQGHLKPQLEQIYLKTMFEIAVWGEMRETRNGITHSLFNKTLSWDLANGFPLLTTKKMYWKGIVEELLFFIRGSTDSSKLSNLGVKIWEPNTSREFLDSNGFTNYSVGEMGPMYGYQWRFFNKPYNPINSQNELNNGFEGVDQLKKVIEEIKLNPNSRRILMTDFNPQQADQGVLYPCHSIIIQFYVQDNRLCCSMYQRSSDFFLGIPFNIASTSLLVHILGQLTNLEPGIVNLIMGDYHLYQTHIDQVFDQIGRIPKKLPKLEIPKFSTLIQVENSSFSDYKILNYESYPAIKAQMIA